MLMPPWPISGQLQALAQGLGYRVALKHQPQQERMKSIDEIRIKLQPMLMPAAVQLDG
jgi:hypothetical protein